jgi:hypothetical protein
MIQTSWRTKVALDYEEGKTRTCLTVLIHIRTPKLTRFEPAQTGVGTLGQLTFN